MRRVGGGRRSEAERAEGLKCAGKDDFLTTDPIRQEYAFRLGRVCFDVLSLRDYITQNDLHDGIIVNKKNPFTREEFSEADFIKINKKLAKLGLTPIILFDQSKNLMFFDLIYDTLESYNLKDRIGSPQYNTDKNGFHNQNPFNFLKPHDECDKINGNDRHHCHFEIGMLEHQYDPVDEEE